MRTLLALTLMLWATATAYASKNDSTAAANQVQQLRQRVLKTGQQIVRAVKGTNKLRDAADVAFERKAYSEAAEAYKALIDSLKQNEGPLVLNLAHAYNKDGNSIGAMSRYIDLVKGNYAKNLQSLAYNELGVLAAANEEAKELLGQIRRSLTPESSALRKHFADLDDESNNLLTALYAFRKALMAAPDHENARYNYELVYRILEHRLNNPEEQEKEEKEQEQKENGEQENEEKENQEKENQEQEGKDGQEQEGKDGQEQDPNEQPDPQEQEGKDGQEQDPKEQEGKEGQEGEEGEGQPKDQQEGQEGAEDGQQGQPGQEGEEQEGDPKAGNDQLNGQQGDEQLNDGSLLNDKDKELMEISDEMVRMILNAKREKEVEYIQMKKRKPSKRTDRSKPDW